MKHTPGPWKSERNEIEDANGKLIAVVSYQQDGYVQANIALIATAPDLLATLRALCSHYPKPIELGTGMAADIQNARAAIAKATPQEDES